MMIYIIYNKNNCALHVGYKNERTYGEYTLQHCYKCLHDIDGIGLVVVWFIFARLGPIGFSPSWWGEFVCVLEENNVLSIKLNSIKSSPNEICSTSSQTSSVTTPFKLKLLIPSSTRFSKKMESHKAPLFLSLFFSSSREQYRSSPIQNMLIIAGFYFQQHNGKNKYPNQQLECQNYIRTSHHNKKNNTLNNIYTKYGLENSIFTETPLYPHWFFTININLDLHILAKK